MTPRALSGRSHYSLFYVAWILWFITSIFLLVTSLTWNIILYLHLLAKIELPDQSICFLYIDTKVAEKKILQYTEQFHDTFLIFYPNWPFHITWQTFCISLVCCFSLFHLQPMLPFPEYNLNSFFTEKLEAISRKCSRFPCMPAMNLILLHIQYIVGNWSHEKD